MIMEFWIYNIIILIISALEEIISEHILKPNWTQNLSQEYYYLVKFKTKN